MLRCETNKSISKARTDKKEIPHLWSSRKKWTLIREQSTEIPHAPISPAGHTALNRHAMSQSRHIHVEMVGSQVDTAENKVLELTL